MEISVSFRRELVMLLWNVLMQGYNEIRTAQGCFSHVSLRCISPLRTSQDELTLSMSVSKVNRSSKPGENPGPFAIPFLVASIW